jgi:methionine biosynthesis protein metW
LSTAPKNEDVAKYYRKSDFFYKHVHSGGGSNIHMALSDDGLFHKEDFKKQAMYIANFLKPGARVLEVGAGRLSNSRYLAERFPDVEFVALDIPNRNFLKNKVPKNIQLVEGDYHDLSQFEDESFDIIFGVETICYSSNKQLVVDQAFKKLKPGGVFIDFDVFEPLKKNLMTDFEKRVSDIALAGMRVTGEDQSIQDFNDYLKKSGFQKIEIENLTQKIMPNLKRLAKISKLYFTHPLLLKILNFTIAEDARINGISGYLMDLTFDGERIHGYYRITAKKPNNLH